MADPAVVVHELTKTFPVEKRYRDLLLHPLRKSLFTALEKVSLSAPAGRLLVLLGPNGAGKSTLIKVLATLVRPNAGWATVFGLDVVRREADVRACMGYITSEERSFYWRLSGRENLRFFATLQGMRPPQRERRVAELIDLVGLADAADRCFRDYSTGMKCRLAIARGLLTNPQLLLMDESTRSLDPDSAAHIRSFVRHEMVEQGGRTVVYATHNLYEAAEIADQVAILHQGQVRLCDTLDAIRHRYLATRPYTLVLDRLPGDWRHPASPLPEVASWQAGPQPDGLTRLEVELASENGAISHLVERLVHGGCRLYACTPRERTLQEVFTEVTT